MIRRPVKTSKQRTTISTGNPNIRPRARPPKYSMPGGIGKEGHPPGYNQDTCSRCGKGEEEKREGRPPHESRLVKKAPELINYI
jgi:hypothetical protein